MKKKLLLIALAMSLGLCLETPAQPSHPQGAPRAPQSMHAKMPQHRMHPMPPHGVMPRPPRHIHPMYPYPSLIYYNSIDPLLYRRYYYNGFYPNPYYPSGFGASFHISI